VGYWKFGRAKPTATTPTSTAIIERGLVRHAVTSTGKIVSNLDVEIKCKASGEVVKLPFGISSCKGQCFCTSCHAKRAVAFAEWLHTTVLLPVLHRQIVLTIPKMLRAYFRYDRRLLGDLCRVAAGGH